MNKYKVYWSYITSSRVEEGCDTVYALNAEEAEKKFYEDNTPMYTPELKHGYIAECVEEV